jgi:DHA1 family tetracycline resistance protein-like MFS transporter
VALTGHASASLPLLRYRGGSQLRSHPETTLQERSASLLKESQHSTDGEYRDAMLLAAAPAAPAKNARPEVALQITAFLFVISVSLTALAPAPHLIAALGEKKGLYLLTAVASTSAAAEIVLSPIMGGLSDSFGRKPALLATLGCVLLANSAAALSPSVPLVVLSKFVSSIVVGIFFLSGGAFLADNYRDTPKKLAAVSGVLFALVNLGFSLGIGLSGAPFMPSSLQGKYAASAGVCACGLLFALTGVRESLPAESRVPFKARSFNPLAFVRLLSVSPRMRSLGILTALASAPMFMGDVLQVFAIQKWELSQSQVVSLFSGVAVSGVLANISGGALIKRLGIRRFNLIASICSIIFWGGFASASLKAAVVCAVLGFLGQARTLSATTMMTSEGARLGIPQGQLSGDRANMIAWLKILGPLVYGQLAAHGSTIGAPTAPFCLNVLLALTSAVLGMFVL